MSGTGNQRAAWLASFAALLCLLAACAQPAARAPTVSVKLIAFNDFHGNLQAPAELKMPVTGPDGPHLEPAGGVEAFSALARELAAKNPLHAMVSAGDMVGASPLLSALFHDQPTIEAMNLVGVDFHGVGNHEFDRGVAHLKRLLYGGCEPDAQTGEPDCGGRPPFAGARFAFLAANVIEDATGKPLFPAYAIREFDGVRVAFIGVTLRGTAALVRPGGTRGVHFLDEADTVNALLPELRRQGIEAFVLLIHEGGRQSGDINSCVGWKGDLGPVLERLDPALQVVVSAHSHQPYVCRFGERLVTSAASSGALLTEIDLELDRAGGRVVAKRAVNHLVRPDGPKDPRLAPLLADYRARAAPRENRIVGSLARELAHPKRGEEETELGNLVADAQLFATSAAKRGGAQIAINNRSSVRGALVADEAGRVRYGALFQIQPFQNDLVVMSLTGEQLRRALERTTGDPERGRLEVSQGFHYDWDPAKPPGQQVVAESMRLEGQPILPAQKYRVAVNSFLAGGSEAHAVFSEGTDRVISGLDLDALVDYLHAHDPYTPPPLGRRVTRLP